MTGKGRSKTEKKEFAISALISAGFGTGAAFTLAVLSSVFLLFTPEPSSFYFPVGLVSLYAGAAVAGFIMMKKVGVPAAALLPGSAVAALAAVAGAFFKGGSDRPVPLNAALFVLIPAVSFLCAAIIGGKKKKRPSVKRRPRRKR